MRFLIRILQTVLALLLCALLLGGGWCLVQLRVMERPAPVLLGKGLLPVEDDAMSPLLVPGDLALLEVRETYSLGDIVLFLDPDRQPVLRRLVGSYQGGWITKAEHLEEEDDALLAPENILGAVDHTLPGAAGLVHWYWSVPGLIVLLAVGMLLLKLPGWLLRPGRPRREPRPEPSDAPPPAPRHTPRHRR